MAGVDSSASEVGRRIYRQFGFLSSSWISTVILSSSPNYYSPVIHIIYKGLTSIPSKPCNLHQLRAADCKYRRCPNENRLCSHYLSSCWSCSSFKISKISETDFSSHTLFPPASSSSSACGDKGSLALASTLQRRWRTSISVSIISSTARDLLLSQADDGQSL
jgi:hypothetical protein